MTSVLPGGAASRVPTSDQMQLILPALEILVPVFSP